MHPGWITLIVIAVIACIVLLIAIYRWYLMATAGRDTSSTCLVGKTAIVTGANSGIGFSTAQDFAKRGARVILACRDPIRAEQAKTKIIEATGNPNVIVRIVDFASLASVRTFVVETKATEERLDILVNNAGAGGLPYSLTPDGLCMAMQINYFGPFLLTVLLLDLLKKSAPSRIVHVSTVLAFGAKLKIEDLNGSPRTLFPRYIAYVNAKLCNILFSNELSRRLRGTGVDTNCLHPGAVKTDISRNLSGIGKAMTNVVRIFSKSSELGAQTSIYLAVSKEVTGITGEYFVDCKKEKLPRIARDGELARKLWERSETFVKLTPEEKKLI